MGIQPGQLAGGTGGLMRKDRNTRGEQFDVL
jgi:hypothetical protein